MKNTGFSIVVAAVRQSLGIGKNGSLPWKLDADTKFFKELTLTRTTNVPNVVIMGRRTFQSIPERFRPLANRTNIVITNNANAKVDYSIPESVITTSSFQEAVDAALALTPTPENIFVIGGASVYDEAMRHPLCQKIYFTSVEGSFEGMDTFFPTISAADFRLKGKSQKMVDGEITFQFLEFERIPDEWLGGELHPLSPAVHNFEEMQYLDLLRRILERGTLRGDRTGTGTLSIFGVQMRFNLRNNAFPLLTTKKVFWRGVAEELLWFVRGCTNAKLLTDKGIHIWDGNASREFLDKCGFTEREEGDLGPVYGFQWRHFGAAYMDMHADYRESGVDQLKECIHMIKNDPNSRRIVLTAWNPSDLTKMALPPCHMFCQFYVANGELSCQMYQRSADMGLGVPFNIASYALLTAMMAQVCDLKPGDFVHTIGDAHIYVNHIEPLREQLQRIPKRFPKLHIRDGVKDIDQFDFSDFTISDYNPDGNIKMKMAV